MMDFLRLLKDDKKVPCFPSLSIHTLLLKVSYISTSNESLKKMTEYTDIVFLLTFQSPSSFHFPMSDTLYKIIPIKEHN